MGFKQTLAMGQLGESRISRWLRGKGYAVLPVYEKELDTGKGPQVFTVDSSLVAPDLFTFNKENGKTFFIEAKHKSVFSWHRISGKWVTGIDIRHYNDYLNVEKLSPWPVWLFFLHVHDRVSKRNEPWPCPVGLFGGELKELSKIENHRSDKWGRSGMVYWAHDKLKLISKLENVPS